MAFKDLIAAKDAAVERDEEAADADCRAHAAANGARATHEETTAAVAAAHAAIRAVLAEKGHHTLQAADHTILVYQVDDRVPEGWAAYHPIPGEGG